MKNLGSFKISSSKIFRKCIVQIEFLKSGKRDTLMKTAVIFHTFIIRALIVAGAEGATEPVNFEQRVHAPVNFQPFQF